MKPWIFFFLVIVASFSASRPKVYSQSSTLSAWPANSYSKVLDVGYCGKVLYVDDASLYSANDWVMLVQHKGASITSEYCSLFGRLSDYGASGNFELARVESVEDSPVSGDDFITLKDCPALFYYAANLSINGFPRDNYYGYQIVKVRYYEGNLSITGDLMAPTWDPVNGTGGVIAIVATGTITLKADIDVSGDGFQGGVPNPDNNTSADLNFYSYILSNNTAGGKGEGNSRYPASGIAGKGAVGNGGGGGNGKNAGGGGGANYGAGGMGGKQNSAETNMENGGVGGWALNYDDPHRTQIFFGGGGGGGHRSAGASNQDDSKGGNGGGIVLLVANAMIVDRSFGEGTTVNRTIQANGNVGEDAVNGPNGAGGGGGGGVVLLDIGTIVVNPLETNLQLIVEANGGSGGNCNGGTDIVGPGGGGGGGVVWFRSASRPANVSVLVSGGANGLDDSNGTPSAHSATSGEAGIEKFNLDFPIYYDENENPI